MVAGIQNALSAQSGLDVLKKGGNAVETVNFMVPVWGIRNPTFK